MSFQHQPTLPRFPRDNLVMNFEIQIFPQVASSLLAFCEAYGGPARSSCPLLLNSDIAQEGNFGLLINLTIPRYYTNDIQAFLQHRSDIGFDILTSNTL